MKSANEIKEEIAGLRDELDAIVAVAEREERDLTEDETARVVAITDTHIPQRNKQLVSASKIESERMQRAVDRYSQDIGQHQLEAGNTQRQETINGSPFAALRVPAKARVHGKLNAYQGPNAERDAYIAGNVILAGIFGNQPAAEFCRQHGLHVQGSMSTSSNTAGGFLVPDEMQATLIRLREERGIFPQFANRVPMGSDIIRVPRLLSDVTAYWVGEEDEITASDATLGSAELMARKLAALTKVSRELDEDAVVDIGDMITQSMAYAMADKIDNAAFNGDGTSTYGGVLGLKNALNSSAIVNAVTGNDAPNNLDLLDFENVVGAYPRYTGANPRWFMHAAVYYASAVRLMDAAGGNTNVTLSNGASEMMFMGYPVSFVQVMHSTTTTSASTIVAYFGDLRLGAAYGTRRSMRTEVSLERYFENDMVGIKCTERVAINIHERGDTIRTRPILALKTAS